jgi:outer membrane protein assembly factor BamD (BamD/ComL family)
MVKKFGLQNNQNTKPFQTRAKSFILQCPENNRQTKQRMEHTAQPAAYLHLPLFILIILFIGLQGCTPKKSDDQLFADALQSEKFALTPETMSLAAENYFEVYLTYPKSQLAAKALFKSANLLNTAAKYQDAVQRFKLIVDKFPDADEHPRALFMLGFINNNDLHDPVAATKYYEQFLAKYPKHDLAPSADFELQNIGKSTEEIFKQKS